MRASPLLLGLLGLAGRGMADPTWPSDIDELEEIMFQLTSFRARKFADTVSPCDNEASGPGRQNAAEWLRVGFHDMSTANTYFGTGGLDGSLQYELTNGENTGPGHATTLEFMAPFVSRKSSLADLIALGVYTSVRSCGGPIVPIRAGRKDAIARGNTGVPQPQNSVLTFQQQFDRMGFTNEEMIQVTACGHTIGGVHSTEFPDIVPVGTGVNGEVGLDESVAVFDNKVVIEYLDGTTRNPLVVGPAVRIGKNSDFKVYNSDGNATMEGLVDNDTFNSVCKDVLQKMIDVVPPSVTLTDPIEPYSVKPVALQLTLTDGGSTLLFSGYIRVKTTDLPEDEIETVTLTYKNRDGGSDCGSGSCRITTTVQGITQGFDDTFAFFPIAANIPASTGISSFTISVNKVDGTSVPYDNNGEEYPLQDAVLLQLPQSCVLGSSGAFTATAAIRNDRVSQGASAFISYKTTQTNSPVPKLASTTVALTEGDCVGEYTFFTVDTTISGGLAYEAYVDIINGDKRDSFKSLVDVGGTCREFANPKACGGGSSTTTAGSTPASASSTEASTASTAPVSTTSVSASESTTVSSFITSTLSTTASTTDSRSTAETTSPTSTTATSDGVSTTTTKSEDTSTTVSSSFSSTTTSATPTLHHRDSVGGYTMVSCWIEASGKRALSAAARTDNDMTLEKCEEYCSDYVYWGTEYGTECYCGNSLASGSEEAPLEDCNMVCGGDSTQYCGAGNRLELYSTTAAPPAPTATIAHVPTVSPFALIGCWTEAQNGRALGQRATAGADMTNEECGDYCEGYRYFGTEYGGECYCGSYLSSTSESAPLEDCNMPCTGDQYSYCGGSNRLELYMNADAQGGEPQQPAAAGDFVWLGCRTDLVNGARMLSGASTADDDLTNETCAEYCRDFEYFGTEYGRECYCGDELSDDSVEAPAAECSTFCAGSIIEFCGAGNRLSVYKKPDPKDVIEEVSGNVKI